MENQEQTIREVVGENVRRIREAAGARQDDVAGACRAVGLTWTRSKIAALERGDKALDLAEAVLLAEALSKVTGRPLGVATDLLAGDGAVRLSPARVFYRHALRSFLADPVPFQASDVPGLADVVAKVPELLEQMASGVTPDDSEKFWQIIDRAGETEERAARTLGLDKDEVTTLAAGLWGRTLAEERDARVGDDVPAASRAAKRGRVTRQLLDELRTKRYGGHGHGER